MGKLRDRGAGSNRINVYFFSMYKRLFYTHNKGKPPIRRFPHYAMSKGFVALLYISGLVWQFDFYESLLLTENTIPLYH